MADLTLADLREPGRTREARRLLLQAILVLRHGESHAEVSLAAPALTSCKGAAAMLVERAMEALLESLPARGADGE